MAERTSSSYVIHNVKAHWKWTNKNNNNKFVMPPHAVQHSNFFTVRYNQYVYSVFDKSSHINVSGIRNFDDIKGAVMMFNAQFSADINVNNISVDNCTASGKLEKNHIVCVQKILAEREKHSVHVRIRSRIFPSIIIRQAKRRQLQGEEKRGTIILFSNKKFIIVGCNSLSSVQKTFQTLCALTQQPSMTCPQQQASVSTVG